MKRWKAYETNLTQHLSKTYPQLMFQTMGGSSSVHNDIRVFQEAKYLLSIEAKYLPSQCGQITLVQTKKAFKFSQKSRQKFMPQTQGIINAINNNELLYENDKRLISWVKAYYLQKNATWFGLSEAYKNLNQSNVYLCPTKHLSNYVDINAILREKKSGSRNLPRKSLQKAKELIKSRLTNASCHTEGFIKKRLYLRCQEEPKELYLSPSLYLSKKATLYYEVRKLSSTKKWSVTFSMRLKKEPSLSSSLV
jgi:hypothetical protein